LKPQLRGAVHACHVVGGDGMDRASRSDARVVVEEAWWRGLKLWYNHQDYLGAMDCWEDALLPRLGEDADTPIAIGDSKAGGSAVAREGVKRRRRRQPQRAEDEKALEEALQRLVRLFADKSNDAVEQRQRGKEDGEEGQEEGLPGRIGEALKNSRTTGVETGEPTVFVSTASLLLFLAGCQLDARQFDKARRTLLDCLRDVARTKEQYLLPPDQDNADECDRDRDIVHRTISEWISSCEEEGEEAGGCVDHLEDDGDDTVNGSTTSSSSPSSFASVGTRIVRMALDGDQCERESSSKLGLVAWRDPYQRPGYFDRSLQSQPVYDANDFGWYRKLQDSAELFQTIREEFLQAYGCSRGGDPSSPSPFFHPVGSGMHRDGAGQHDGRAVQQGQWTECVLFGSTASSSSSAKNVAPRTKRWIEQNVPEAVSLANAGGGEGMQKSFPFSLPKDLRTVRAIL